jgi:ankyrin repeat protein
MKLLTLTFIFCSPVLSNQIHAAQAAQQSQKEATYLELQMIDEAIGGDLTKDKLENYLKQGADINAKNNEGDTALMVAAYKNHREIVEALSAAKADINAKNRYGNTAVMWAALHGRANAVQALIVADADLNAKDNYSYTALMWAALNNRPAIVELLIAADADKNIVNEKDDNKKARDFARDKIAYDEAVAAGEKQYAEHQAYLARQKQAKKLIADEQQLIPEITDIIAGLAYGPSPSDLPENTPIHRQENT